MSWRRPGLLGLLMLTLLLGGVGCKRATRSHWIKEMSRKLPGELCKEGTYFRECFQISRSECERVAAATTDKCLDKYRSRIPRILKQPQDGRHWGGKVGACAGTAFEKRLIAKQRITPKCAAIIEKLKRQVRR